MRRGVTLLEVILSLGVLTTSLAVLGELVRLGTRNAAAARDLTQAQMLCESKLNEILSAVSPLESVQGQTFAYDPDWTCTVEVQAGPQEGLLAVRVTVTELVTHSRPIEYSLVRWVRDPDYSPPTAVDSGTGG
jgi:hypothetical protein